jgi:two-component system nitrogen regulation response regulator GlnG
LVQSGRIRNDLFYFLSPFVIRVPALRDRREDLELLVSHFIQRIAHVSSAQQGQGPPRVSSAALQLLKEYDWPGNIAELKSVLQGVLTESRGAILATDVLRRFLQSSSSTDSRSDAKLTNSQTTPVAGQATSTHKFEVGQAWDLKAFVDEQVALGTDRLYEQAVEHLDSQLLKLVLEHTSGNRVKAAKLLGITRTSLRRKMNSGLLTELTTDPSDDLRPGDEHD